MGISIFFILFSILTTLYFGIAYGKNSKDIYLQQIEVGKWVSSNIPKESIIALNDKDKLEIKLEVVDKHRVSYFTTYYWFYQ